VCPLDWGLGHATRCVPIINALQTLGYPVIIGADKASLAFLKGEFPDVPTVVIPGHSVSYGKKRFSFFLTLFYEGIRFYRSIKKEHNFLNSIIKEHQIAVVISDNRYGLWNKKVKSIFITHQLFIKTPFLTSFLHQRIKRWVANFDACWVPDVQGNNNLSGDLAHSASNSANFIGPLSRFQHISKRVKENYVYDVFISLSGPEPQRSILEKIIVNQLKGSSLKAVVLRGLPNVVNTLPERDNIVFFNHLPTNQFLSYLESSKVVISRSGYSSIMDLVTLQKSAILIPTPGQTEQEYLANYHFEKGNFYMQQQDNFNLMEALDAVKKFSPKEIGVREFRIEDFLS